MSTVCISIVEISEDREDTGESKLFTGQHPKNGIIIFKFKKNNETLRYDCFVVFILHLSDMRLSEPEHCVC